MSDSVLVLRPEPGATATACRARALGLEAIVAPLFTVRALAWDTPAAADFDAIALTSANAARHAGAALAAFRALPLYAVGAATATAARAAGFVDIHSGAADAAALVRQARADGGTRLLHLAGRDHHALACDGLAVTTRLVYEAVPSAALAPAAVDALARGAVALLHSPRAAALFRVLAGRVGVAPTRICVAAISPAALAVAGSGWAAAAAARVPTDDALLAAAAGLCDQGAGRDG